MKTAARLPSLPPVNPLTKNTSYFSRVLLASVMLAAACGFARAEVDPFIGTYSMPGEINDNVKYLVTDGIIQVSDKLTVTKTDATRYSLKITEGANTATIADLLRTGNRLEKATRPTDMGPFNMLDFVLLSDGTNRAFTFIGQEKLDATDLSFTVSSASSYTGSVTLDDFVGTWNIDARADLDLLDTANGFVPQTGTFAIQKTDATHIQVTPSWGDPLTLLVSGKNAVLNGGPVISGNTRYETFRISSDGMKLSFHLVATAVNDSAIISVSIGLGVKEGRTQPVITWANPKAITYGTALSATQLNAKANVLGTLAYSPAAGTKLPAGRQPLNVTFTPKDPLRYNSAQLAVDLTVNQAAATITLAGLSQTYTGQPRPVTTTTVPAGLNVDVTYGGVAVVPVAAGSYPVVATVNDPSDSAGRIKTGTLVVAKAAQSITFPAPPALHYGDADCPLTASASSGLAVSYVSSNPAVATIVDGNKLHVVGVGSVKVTASQAGDSNWKPALAVAKTLVVAKQLQTIDFPALTGLAMGDVDFAPGASASSGLTVTFTSSAPAVATVVAGKIHLVGKGTAVITASQVGNANWAAAPPVKQTLLVAPGSQQITFLPLPSKGVGDVDFAPGATASSGLTVTYTSSNPQVATIVAGKIHVLGEGSSTITARQAGNASWSAAPDVTQSLTVGGKATPVLTWANPAAITYGTVLSTTQLNAKANVPGTYAYSPPAGTTLPAGQQSLNVTFIPTDAAKYNSAQKSVSLTVNKVAATITLVGLSQTYTGQPRIVTATTVPAGLNVDITYNGSPDAPTNTGSYAVVATINDSNAGGTKTGTLVVGKGNQTINFASLPAIHVGGEDFSLTTSATSGLAVSYASSTPTVATIVDGKIHAVAAGSTFITATQAGDSNWNAALPVKQTLTVPTDDQDIRAFYATMKSMIETHDEAGFVNLFAPDYFHAGQDLATRFDLGTGMLDSLKTFTFAITGITVTGSDATVAGFVTLAFNNGDPVQIWAEPDTANNSPGIGWLHKTADGWRVMGNQARASYYVTGIHYPSPGDDHYFFRFHTDSTEDITSVNVSGPSIETTPLEADPGMGGVTGFAGHFSSAQRPPVGSVYSFVIDFTDGTQEIYQDTIKSWVPAAPVVSVVPGAGTATISWTNVKASVPNAASYGVRIYGADGESDSIWRGSEQLPLTQTSIDFNADGTATGELVDGQSYTAVVTIFDIYGNYAFRTCGFTMPQQGFR
jgi:hypothetical protein